jgi:hypothetical protein
LIAGVRQPIDPRRAWCAIQEAMALDIDPVGFCLFRQVVKTLVKFPTQVTVHLWILRSFLSVEVNS